jgi:ribonuclease HI
VEIYIKKLLKITLALKKQLKRNNIIISFNSASIKNYMIKINILPGHDNILIIYYKPTTNTYTLKKYLNNISLNNIIDIAWNNIHNFRNYSAESGIHEAFVDGSYINETIGYGSIIYLGEEIKKVIFGTITDIQVIKHRQFVGELQAVIETVNWCKINGVQKIRINYDYIGIKYFAIGAWKPNNIVSKTYKHFMLNSNIIIKWRHIKGHSGNINNILVDNLVKANLKKNIK